VDDHADGPAAPVSASSPSVKWAILRPEGLRLRAISAAYALYHEASGQTHIIGEEARAILAALADGPLGVRAIFDRLALHYDLDVGNGGAAYADPLVALTGRLRELERLGLVRALGT